MSKREDLESKIREQRVLEATKKGLVGASGKIGTVLRMLGSDIVRHDEESGAAAFLDMEDDRLEPRSVGELLSYIPTMDDEENQRPEGQEWGEIGETHLVSTRKIGMHFDGLSRGMHMEIKYDEERSELALSYRGYPAYREVMGDIEIYIPDAEWEGWIEKLWILSRDMQRRQKEEEFKKKTEETTKAKDTWLESLMKKWGKI